MRLTKSRAALIAIRHFWLRATGAFFTINRCGLIDCRACSLRTPWRRAQSAFHRPDPALGLSILSERNSHPVVSSPDYAARKLQAIILDDQVEIFRKRKKADRVRKLDCRASNRNVTHCAWIFVAAIFGDGALVKPIARGNPGFSHDESKSSSRWRMPLRA
jgi:hypothetical protein